MMRTAISTVLGLAFLLCYVHAQPTVTTRLPDNIAENVAKDANIVFTFSAPIVAGTGNILLKTFLDSGADSPADVTIAVGDAQVVAPSLF